MKKQEGNGNDQEQEVYVVDVADRICAYAVVGVVAVGGPPPRPPVTLAERLAFTVEQRR